MKLQTLVVTTNRKDLLLPAEMNIQTEALVGNQCGSNAITEFDYNGHRIRYISTDTRGVGVNRNEILLRAEGDICVLADDDMTFLNGYDKTVQEWFEKLPDADMLIFNLEGGKKRHKHKRVTRIHKGNYGRYGAARLAFRLTPLKFSGVMFHTMFGGGCEYSSGEDTLFLRECLRKGLKIYGVPATLAQIRDEESTWFRGYNDKYFFDKGVLYYVLNRRLCGIHSIIHCLRYSQKYRDYGIRKAIWQMMKGIESVK